MILIFDLDDTLYPEIDFVKSGLRAVAIYLNRNFSWPVDESFAKMIHTLNTKGRGLVFNDLLEHHDCLKKRLVRQCVTVYRYHRPKIQLTPSAMRLLPNLPRKPYVVTDGHKDVQNSKLDALGVKRYLEKYYITHRYGVCNAKPSIYCFNLIRKRENCNWNDMCYVGDNPRKDFVNLNQVGVHTIRVLTGGYSDVQVTTEFDARFKVNSLDEIRNLLGKIIRH
jgi:putative hydrolase of the HAD superfamily